MTKSQLRWRMIIDAFGVFAFVPFIVLGFYVHRLDMIAAGTLSLLAFGMLWCLDYSDRWWRVIKGKYP